MTSSTADGATDSWSEPTPDPDRRAPAEPEPTQAIHRHPLDEPRRVDPVDEEALEPQRRGRGLGANRHLSSILLCLLAVVGAYGALDFGVYRANTAVASEFVDGRMPDQAIIWLSVAAGCMLVAGLCARISAVGPLLVGLVLGVGPAVWVLLDFGSFVARLDDLPEIWDNTTFGLSAVSFAVFPIVGGVLVGAALAGRWRRPLKKSDVTS
jgi:hypothetical protein